MKYIVLILMVVLVTCNNKDKIVDKSTLTGNDYRLFQETPAWTLAKSVDSEDTIKIKEEVNDKKVNVDFQEPTFGNTVLMIAVVNSDYESVKTLLNLKANPNLKDTYFGSSAMIDAAANEDPKYLRLLLSYAGDPNSIEDAPVKKGNEARSTPLNTAITLSEANGLEKVRMLVEAGANINYSSDGDPAYTTLPLADALLSHRMDIVLYLLEKGADYKRVMYKEVNKHEVNILEALRKSMLELSSSNYVKKLQVIAFLKQKGLDYIGEPIPDYILKTIKNKHPNDWEEYIKRY